MRAVLEAVLKDFSHLMLHFQPRTMMPAAKPKLLKERILFLQVTNSDVNNDLAQPNLYDLSMYRTHMYCQLHGYYYLRVIDNQHQDFNELVWSRVRILRDMVKASPSIYLCEHIRFGCWHLRQRPAASPPVPQLMNNNNNNNNNNNSK
jgi:hypothetical protein